jgi:hypothetical protein
MRTIAVGLLIIVCLAVIAIPAFVPVPQPPSSPVSHDREGVRPLRFDSPLIWTRFSPFGARAEGWQGILSAGASWVYLYLTSVLLLALVPRRVKLITQALKAGGARAQLRLLLIGFLATLASVLLVALARFAFVWIVLIVILAGAVFVLSYLGVVAISLMVGAAVRRWVRFAPSVWAELAIGSLILFALGRIPVAGWILVGVVTAWGLGAVLATHLGSGEAWSIQDWKTVD